MSIQPIYQYTQHYYLVNKWNSIDEIHIYNLTIVVAIRGGDLVVVGHLTYLRFYLNESECFPSL